MNRLVLRYDYDASFFDRSLARDDFGRLSVTVETNRFSGRGGFWVQWQDVVEFGEALAAFPIPTEVPIAVQWGFDMQTGDDLILRIEIAAADKRGNLVARVEIADDFQPRNRVRTSFQTNCPDLDAFRTQIARLMAREIEEAVLIGR